MKRLIALLISFFLVWQAQAQHPVAFATRAELQAVKGAIPKYPLLQQSYTALKQEVDAWLGKDIDVPVPKDPAGGYTHDKHKTNYTLLFNSGLLYQLTGDNRYALLAKNIFLKYAVLNPTLKNHPQATSSSPGRLFWQALNDANWLVYAGMAYDLIQPTLTPAERTMIETGAFKPEVDYLTGDLKDWFNLIHNHGVWACAGVGMVGIATGNTAYVEKALYGTEKTGRSGFLAQLDGLFSPDGYYTEGPYYVRYAILPYYIFANALNNARPDLKIFQYRNQILKKALEAGLQQTNTDGIFFPINDAIKDKDYTANELVTAVDIAWTAYGADSGLLTVAQKQGRVLLNRGGTAIAAALARIKNVKATYPYRSVEYTDGKAGNEGGLSLLRTGSGSDLTTLIFKYASHGLSHGHYDQLGLSLFDKGTEVLPDYGSARFVGVEQKYGGRYLPENKSYAAQTIAHSTLVVDEQSQFEGREETAEKYHGEKRFSNIGGTAVQAVSAVQEGAYKGVGLQRSVYLLQLPNGRRLLVDLFAATSATPHQYDLPFQYNGQVIHTSFPYKPATATLQPLGNRNGYQHLWKEAEATTRDSLVQFTFLSDQTYYSISSLVTDSARIFFTRSGAADPSFNLRREPSYILRKWGTNSLFVNTVEMHGRLDPVAELSVQSYPSVRSLQVLTNNETYTIVKVVLEKDVLLIAQANEPGSDKRNHSVTASGKVYEWTGPFTVIYNNQPLK